MTEVLEEGRLLDAERTVCEWLNPILNPAEML